MNKEAVSVFCVLVTGEKAIGMFTGTTSPTTGSYLVEHVTTEDGKKADYAWAESIEL